MEPIDQRSAITCGLAINKVDAISYFGKNTICTDEEKWDVELDPRMVHREIVQEYNPSEATLFTAYTHC